jgi:hypothetical protein
MSRFVQITGRSIVLTAVLAGFLPSCATKEDDFGWQKPVKEPFHLRLHRYRVENEAKNDDWFDRIMHHPVGNSGITTGYPEPD